MQGKFKHIYKCNNLAIQIHWNMITNEGGVFGFYNMWTNIKNCTKMQKLKP